MWDILSHFPVYFLNKTFTEPFSNFSSYILYVKAHPILSPQHDPSYL